MLAIIRVDQLKLKMMASIQGLLVTDMSWRDLNKVIPTASEGYT
jgi:hypothetical protein